MEAEVVQHLGRTSILELILVFFPQRLITDASLFSHTWLTFKVRAVYHISNISVASELPFPHIRWDSHN